MRCAFFSTTIYFMKERIYRRGIGDKAGKEMVVLSPDIDLFVLQDRIDLLM